MAEATLTISFDRTGGVRSRPTPAGADETLCSQSIASVGPAVRGMEIEVRAPDGSALPDGAIGEVCTRGALVFSGYYRDEDATAECLQDGWLRTGDVGFVADGELWITGRLKDLIIVNGQNVMPHELEWIAEEVTRGGGSRRCGAFSVHSDPATEQPVLVVEVEAADGDELDETRRSIRKRVGDATGLALLDVAFVRRGGIPKTTSGKVQRRELRRRYLARELDRIDTKATP
jgi:fatty-acyl-CoA synthase